MKNFYIFTFIMTIWSLSNLYGPFQVLLFNEMGLSIFQIAIVFSSFSIVALIADPIFGKLSDKIGRKSMILSGMFTKALTPIFYVLVFAKSIFCLIGVRIFHAISHALMTPITYAYTQDVVKKKSSATFFGIYKSLTKVGVVLSSVIGGFIVASYGIKSVFILSSIFLFIVFVVSIFFLKETLKKKRKKKLEIDIDMRDEYEEYFSYKKGLIALAVLGFCLALFSEIRLMIFPLFALEQGINIVEIGMFFAGVQVFMIFSQYIFGVLEDRVGAKLPLFIAYIIISVSIFILSNATTFLYTIISALLFSFGLSIATPASLSLLHRLIPKAKRGQYDGIYIATQKIGAITGPLLAATVILMGFSFSFVFLLTGCIVLFGTIISGILLKLQPFPQIMTKIKI